MIALPIDELRESFCRTLARLGPQARLVLTAPTGSGKSTRVPVWCWESSQEPVLVVEPRRVAARTLAEWVAEGLSGRLGETVGYSVRFEARHNAQTPILFVTPGVCRRFLVDGTINRFGTVIFDEFHERSWETDAVLAVMAARSDSPRLLIMSATLGAGELCARYGAELLEAHGRSFPVSVEYLEEPSQELTVPSERRVVERAARAVRTEWSKLEEGSMLVFLPGLKSMTELASSLSGLPTVLLHGAFGSGEQSKAFDPSYRKVVLATNVAESSLTIPDVVTVVDAGLEKRQIHQSGYVALATVPVALSSADQRAGRAGRVRPGRCLRLWSESARLETVRPPDLCRMELQQVLLFLAALDRGLNTPAVWMDAPPEFAWQRARRQLESLGFVDSAGMLTPLGSEVEKLPIDAEWARVLVRAPAALLPDLCDLAALATARRSPLKATRSEEVAKARKEDWGEEAWGQLLAMLRVGRPDRHALDAEALDMVRKVSAELLHLRGGSSTESLKPHPELKSFLARHWPDRFFLLRDGRMAWGNGKVECRMARGEDLPEETVAAFFLQVQPSVGRGLKVELHARWALPVKVSVLREAGLGEPQLSKIRWIDGKLSARVCTVHAGRELGSSERVLEGKELRRGLRALAEVGKFRPELLQELEKELFYESLYAQLQGLERQEKLALDALEERLESLGVEQVEDLDLLETEDFLAPTVPEWEREKLHSDYPRIYSIGGVSFEMEYQPLRKLVVMHSLAAGKGVKLKPQHLPRWNGWRVELDERGRRTNLR